MFLFSVSDSGWSVFLFCYHEKIDVIVANVDSLGMKIGYTLKKTLQCFFPVKVYVSFFCA